MSVDRPRLPEEDRTVVVERVETHVDERPVSRTAAPVTNVNTAATSPVWTATRVVALLFTVLEVLLLFRVLFRLLGANANQPLVAALYGITDPLVRPFEGIFSIQRDVALDVAALLSVVFLALVAALIVALVRAIDARNA